jgi:hypothetical protein
MTELPGSETPDAHPECLDGADYWNELTLVLRGITASKKWQAELLERAQELRRHLSEPVSSPARIHIPEDSQAYISRDNEVFPRESEEFEAYGVEAFDLDKLVLFNPDARLWLIVPDPSSDLDVEVDVPEDPSE